MHSLRWRLNGRESSFARMDPKGLRSVVDGVYPWYGANERPRRREIGDDRETTGESMSVIKMLWDPRVMALATLLFLGLGVGAACCWRSSSKAIAREAYRPTSPKNGIAMPTPRFIWW